MPPAEWLPHQQHEHDGLPRLPAELLHRRREGIFLLLSGLFLGTLAMLNILGITRFIELTLPVPLLGEIPMPLAVGVLPYPITFLCTDFISELYGQRRANQVVWMGLLLNLWIVLILWLGGALPPEPQVDPASGEILAGSPGAVFFAVRELAFGAVAASMIAYLVAQLVDVRLFHLYKSWTRGRHLWLRNNGSTLVSQLVDTVSVICITHFWANALPVDASAPLFGQLLGFILAGYSFKVAAALVDTVPFYLGAPRLARYLRLPPPHVLPHPSATAAVEAGVG